MIDCWRVLRPEIADVTNVLLLGRGSSSQRLGVSVGLEEPHYG